MKRFLIPVMALLAAFPAWAEALPGYYRQPALHGKTIVFHAEGDLWRVPVSGGTAQRLTTHLERERHPHFSPDGRTIAFTASYDGPSEIYTMPLEGGRPTRITYEGGGGRRAPYPVGWKSPTELMYATWFFSRRDSFQIAVANLESNEKTVLPLEQASDGVFASKGKSFFFTRLPRQSSFAKRYTGGYIENLWRFDAGAEEAVPLTADYEGTSRAPMVWKKRLYFASDRDGTMNIWSMTLDGVDLQQHTEFAGWDVLEPALQGGRVVFRNGADLWIYEIAKDRSRKVEIKLASDFDQSRTRWVENPFRYLESYGLSSDGKQVVVTVRGRSFVAPVKPGRLVSLPQEAGTRYRSARFLPESGEVYLLSDQSGEFEFWKYKPDGTTPGVQVTKDATTRLYDGEPSPDGKQLAYTDRNQVLWLLDLASGKTREVARSTEGNEFDRIDLSWSPDSRWFAFVDAGANMARRIFLYDTQGDAKPVPVTTDRLDSYSPAWGADGKWLYFLSDRSFRSVQSSPWGARQPEPYLDRTTNVFLLDLIGGQRSPFEPADELVKSAEKKLEVAEPEKSEGQTVEGQELEKKEVRPKPQLLLDGLATRLHRAPLETGNYYGLTVAKKSLYLFRSPLELGRDQHLITFPITADREKHKWLTVAGDIRSYRLSGDGTTLLVRKGDDLHVFPANGKAPSNFSGAKVSFAGLGIEVSPAEEWRQLFVDAWRMHRDYFYDPGMHGVDWLAMRRKHEVLLPRITSRWELDDLIGQMVGELSAMHTDVRTGEVPDAPDGAFLGYLGARLSRSTEAGGYRIDALYQGDPDFLESLSPLAQPGMDVAVGDVITALDGKRSLSVPDLAILLQNKSGRQVLLETVRPGQKEKRRTIVTPLSMTGFRNLKLTDWEHTRRLETEKRSAGEIGYFHMRGMSGSNFAEFVKGYYPVFNRKGLIIDMRQNYGGNIDSWILSRLLRRRWMYWASRNGDPAANMQFAFGGHMVVLIDAYTISDGEAFSEGFRRLGLGPLIGTKTWGGGIWLRGHTRLTDGGLARTPETGVYTADDGWIIEGGGIKPDIRVDNLPHATFKGKDAQLEAALAYLKKKIADDPPVVPPPPPRPDKSFVYPARK